MAELKIDGVDLVLHLTRLEELEALHGDLKAPLKAVQSIEVLEDAHDAADHGFKVGERLPGHSEVAVVYFDGRKIFAAVHHGTPRGLRIAFTGESYDEWIVGSTDPESLKSLIDAAR